MTENRLPQSRVDELISQDAGISELQLQEFRMHLEKSLEKLERQADSSRRNAIRSVAAAIVCSAFAFLMNLFQGIAPEPSPVLSVLSAGLTPVWTVITWVAVIAAAFFFVQYWAKHRPALERGRTDLHIAMFGELQQQIAALNQRLGEKAS